MSREPRIPEASEGTPRLRLPLAAALVAALLLGSTAVLTVQTDEALRSVLLGRALDRATAFTAAAGATPLGDGVLARMAARMVQAPVRFACVYRSDGQRLCPTPPPGYTPEAEREAVREAVRHATAPGEARYEARGGGGLFGREDFALWLPFTVGMPATAPVSPGPQIGGTRVLLVILGADAAGSLGRQTLVHAALVGLLVLVLLALTTRYAREVRRAAALARQRAAERRFVALGRLSGVLAHEIRNPLGAIKGFAQYTARRFPPEDPAHDDLAMIVSESTRLEGLVQTLLDYARPKPPALAPLGLPGLAQLVQRAARLVAEEAKAAGVDLRVDVDGAAETAPAHAALAVDAEQLTGALLNLLRNAVEAAADRGDEAQAEGASGTVSVTITVDAHAAHVTVQDDGPGVDPAVLPDIFEAYVTGKARGTGLGLAVTRRVAQAHGGDVTVVSSPGEGARFTLSLPLAPTAEPHDSSPGPSKETAP